MHQLVADNHDDVLHLCNGINKTPSKCTNVVYGHFNPVWNRNFNFDILTLLQSISQKRKHFVDKDMDNMILMLLKDCILSLELWHRMLQPQDPNKAKSCFTRDEIEDAVYEGHTDRLVGTAAIRLSNLSLHGFPQICGWFDVRDCKQQTQGQIYIYVSPREDLAKYLPQFGCGKQNNKIPNANVSPFKKLSPDRPNFEIQDRDTLESCASSSNLVQRTTYDDNIVDVSFNELKTRLNDLSDLNRRLKMFGLLPKPDTYQCATENQTSNSKNGLLGQTVTAQSQYQVNPIANQPQEIENKLESSFVSGEELSLSAFAKSLVLLPISFSKTESDKTPPQSFGDNTKTSNSKDENNNIGDENDDEHSNVNEDESHSDNDVCIPTTTDAKQTSMSCRSCPSKQENTKQDIKKSEDVMHKENATYTEIVVETMNDPKIQDTNETQTKKALESDSESESKSENQSIKNDELRETERKDETTEEIDQRQRNYLHLSNSVSVPSSIANQCVESQSLKPPLRSHVSTLQRKLQSFRKPQCFVLYNLFLFVFICVTSFVLCEVRGSTTHSSEDENMSLDQAKFERISRIMRGE
ncbi:hypothetical protein RFI_04263 [Reticulomyxa filosa]|uniref:C2 domain-containing protein n=1 Tax=Reticulomyxa filosa TaxID=46433 RepID=X6P3T7_RETFI|nr:hypothetical protein RFI_04263 [Reticulomyxa filosa]|eukprot:ETO32856.1 hypothetical protein RFI_04263 [Reticulomyxa filosa]